MAATVKRLPLAALEGACVVTVMFWLAVNRMARAGELAPVAMPSARMPTKRAAAKQADRMRSITDLMVAVADLANVDGRCRRR